MKTEFWKHQVEVLFAWPLAVCLSLTCSIVGIVLTIKEVFYWPILVFGFLMLLICIYSIFFQKRTLSKVIFSESGIQVIRLKKKLMFINWNDITDVKSTPYSRGAHYLSFVAGSSQIDITPTKKIYEAIMILYPYQGIKTMINNNYHFRSLYRKK